VVPNVPKPEVVESSDAPYARRMRLGSKRSVLTPNIPHDWLRKYLESVDEVEHMFAGGNALTPEMIAILAEAGNVKHMSFGSIHLLSEEAALVLPLLTSVEKITIGTNHPFSSNSGPVEDEFNPLLSPFFLMPGVHTVEISGTINDELLRMVSEQSRITCLRLGNLDDLRREGKITTAGVMHLGDRKSVE